MSDDEEEAKEAEEKEGEVEEVTDEAKEKKVRSWGERPWVEREGGPGGRARWEGHSGATAALAGTRRAVWNTTATCKWQEPGWLRRA